MVELPADVAAILHRAWQRHGEATDEAETEAMSRNTHAQLAAALRVIDEIAQLAQHVGVDREALAAAVARLDQIEPPAAS